MRIAIAVAALLLPATLSAQEPTARDTFQLFTSCSKMYVFVGVRDKGNEIPALTESSVRRTVVSRLRAARIYNAEAAFNSLSVGVMIVGNAFSVSTEFRPYVVRHGHAEPATTWQTGTTGRSGYDAGYVRDVVASHLDEFIDEYLRVNEDACP